MILKYNPITSQKVTYIIQLRESIINEKICFATIQLREGWLRVSTNQLLLYIDCQNSPINS